jgi:SNF2 family DNA or RNA helicase
MLRPYQLEDAAFLAALPAAANFSEQRTGKTPVSLEVIRRKGLKKVVVVCPASAVYQWKDEFERWLGRPCVALVGTPVKRAELMKQWTDGLIVSYGTLKMTAHNVGEVTQILEQSPEAVILDEAHRIKNKASCQAIAAFMCIQIPFRMALTGTPAPGKTHKVWSILHFLYPKAYKSYWAFIEAYFGYEIINARGRSFREIRPIKPAMERVLQEELARFAVSRKRKEVMRWLPEKDYQRIKLPLTDKQKKQLTELEDYFETGDVIVQGVLDRLMRYRQICLAPELIGLPGKSPKMDWIDQYLEDYPDRPTILFSKFTSFLRLVEKKHHGEVEMIAGDTPIGRREKIRQDFQSGRLKFLLVNIDAGKEALTLDTAQCVIFTDKFPPCGDIAQAEDRFVATTQDKADKGHLIIELMMKDSYDESLYDLIAQRKSETDVVNDFRRRMERRTNGDHT